ncbi:MAG: hypothetical protein LBE56_12620 [Tannerella sp.]|jgi:hypothetical protein|nr:hypothetical protein [Tannerella sp.]
MANNNIRKSVGCDSGITGGNTYNARYQYTLDLDGGNFVLDTPEIDGTVSGAYPAGQTIYIPSVKPVKEGYTFKQ